MESSSRSQAAPSAPPELENSNSESHVPHTDPKFQGAIRSHKKEQNTSKFRKQPKPRNKCDCRIRAYNLGPNSRTSEHFPNKSDFPKQKHITVKTHIEVINHRPQQKRSVNEDRVQTEKKKRENKRLKALWFQLLQGVSQSPSLDQHPLAANLGFNCENVVNKGLIPGGGGGELETLARVTTHAGRHLIHSRLLARRRVQQALSLAPLGSMAYVILFSERLPGSLLYHQSMGRARRF